MKVCFKSFVVLTVLMIYCDLKCRANNFNTRTTSEWRRLWHSERHRRCYHDLVSHMETVCVNDIYKVTRRSQQIPAQQHTLAEAESVILTVEKKDGKLKRVKRGIMDECCSDKGCSWEEYAEYCPTNRRIRTK